MKTTGIIFWIALVGTLPAADELEQQREQLLKAVDQVWDAVAAEPEEPVIPHIKLENGGSALDFIRQMEASLGKDEPSPIVVAVPARELGQLRIESLELKKIPLGAAMGILSKITHLRTTKRDGNWWVERVETSGGEFVTRTYRFTPENLKAVGLEYDGNVKSANVSRGGKGWPVEKGTMATYIPSSTRLVVRAPEKEIKELDAISLLLQAGYEVTPRK